MVSDDGFGQVRGDHAPRSCTRGALLFALVTVWVQETKVGVLRGSSRTFAERLLAAPLLALGCVASRFGLPGEQQGISQRRKVLQRINVNHQHAPLDLLNLDASMLGSENESGKGGSSEEGWQQLAFRRSNKSHPSLLGRRVGPLPYPAHKRVERRA